MKTCVSCGEDRNPDDARFCAGCGTPLVSATSEASAPVEAAAPAEMVETAAETVNPSDRAAELITETPPDHAAAPELEYDEPAAIERYEEPDWAESSMAASAVAAANELAPARESRYWAIAAHATALFGGFLGGIPAFLGPLVVWLIRKDDDAWSAGHGRDALNFNLSVLAYGFALGILSIVTLGIGLLIAIPGWIFLALGWFALTIVGTIKAADDKRFKYPLTIRFVK